MKRVLILLLLLSAVLGCVVSNASAFAVDLPYIVVGKDVWLLGKENGNKLFILPETYYARIDNLDDTFYYVTFNGVAGKVERSAASTIGYHAEAKGTMRELRVDPKYSVFTEVKLKSTMEGGSKDIPVPVNESFVFIGKYPMGELWYYVKWNDAYGYISATITTDADVVIETFVPEEKPGEPTIDAPPPKENNNIIKILVITGLSVALVILLIFIFRPKKKGANRYYYEDMSE